MALGAAIAHALRHGVGLVPDDVLPQIPAIRLECERHAPRDPDQILFLEPTGYPRRPRRSCSIRQAAIADAIDARTRPGAGIGITEVEPHDTVVSQHTPDLMEDGDQRRDKQGNIRFRADLLVTAFRTAMAAAGAEHAGRGVGALVAPCTADDVVAVGIATDPRRRTVVSQVEVRRARHDALHREIGQRWQHVAAVTHEDTHAAASLA